MKRISYRNKDFELQLPLKTELPSIGNSNDTSTENAGRFSYILPGTTDDQELPDQKMNNSEHVEIIRHLVEVADDLDKENLEVEASFLDFLINKFAAATTDLSEEERYVEYIYKIYNSDMEHSIDKIKTITDKYSKFIASDNSDKETSKHAAFEKIIIGGS